MNILNDKKGIICDMDGVLYHGGKLLEGVKDISYKFQLEYTKRISAET
jgi:ribonucleotide monophosphatase NagD (HAD superfamily)